MKNSAKTVLAAMFGLACVCPTFAAKDAKADGFMMKHQVMMITENGETRPMVGDMKLNDGTEVRDDGVVIIPSAGRTALHEGDTMSFGGTIIRAATGTVEATADGVMIRGGQLLVTKDGKTSAMTGEFVELNDGTRVMKDGSVITPDGQQRSTLRDGDEILMNGTIQKS